MSDLTLVRQLEDLRRAPNEADPFEVDGKVVLPNVASDLAAGIQPAVYFTILPGADKTAKRRVNIEIVRDGQLIAKRTSPLAVPDSSGRIRVLLQSERQPGSYVLKVSVPLKSGTLERSIAYSVSALPPTS